MRDFPKSQLVRAAASLLLSALLCTASTLSAGELSRLMTSCAATGTLIRLPELPEASGIAVGRRTPGRLWAHNDSGEPTLVALDAQGSVTGRIRLTGAAIEDWEAVAVGPCPAGSCLYIADIGDNNANRKSISVYRIPEPAGADGSAALTEVFHATYPDGPHDAEALLAGPDGVLHIVTKGDTGPIALYKFPRELRPGSTVRLERVGVPAVKNPDEQSRITDGAVSPDGRWTALRTRSTLMFYRSSDLFGGHWRESTRVDLTPLHEPQGEGVAIGPDGGVFLVGEGGGKGQAGTFARFTCTPQG